MRLVGYDPETDFILAPWFASQNKSSLADDEPFSFISGAAQQHGGQDNRYTVIEYSATAAQKQPPASEFNFWDTIEIRRENKNG